MCTFIKYNHENNINIKFYRRVKYGLCAYTAVDYEQFIVICKVKVSVLTLLETK